MPPYFTHHIAAIEAFCRQWHVAELAVFGSVSAGTNDAESDVDLLVTFTDDAQWGLLDHVEMEEQLQAILGRNVDLVTRNAVERSKNWIRRRNILDSAETIFRAA